jgi:hypothetical protein
MEKVAQTAKYRTVLIGRRSSTTKEELRVAHRVGFGCQMSTFQPVSQVQKQQREKCTRTLWQNLKHNLVMAMSSNFQCSNGIALFVSSVFDLWYRVSPKPLRL